LALVQSLAAGTFLVAIRQRIALEDEPELRETLDQLVEQLDAQNSPKAMVVAC
jgi:hypothetical protein